jgi:phage replication-related protein YjqB (UPF0714/DUF867 family)
LSPARGLAHGSRTIRRHMGRHDAGYQCYADLAKAQTEGTDFRVSMRLCADSSVAIVAPHGGGIEAGTSEIARAVAGNEFNLYLFEGLRSSGNYAALHLTSHRFDEPRCLQMLSRCDHVLAIHGCKGEARQAYIGGLDEGLKLRMAVALEAVGVEAITSGHRFPAREPRNICNCGRRRAGVQIELTNPLRLQGPCHAVADAIRSVLLAL